MARPNKVWFRKDIGWWMVTLDGKKIRLAQGKANRKSAEQKFHELKASQAHPIASNEALVADIIDRFLAWSQIHRSVETNRNHKWYGQQFAEHIGYLKATDLRPIHVTEWVDVHKWGQTTQRNARRSIYRAFAWAVEEGLLATNPLKGMKCPAPLTRQRVMTDQEFRTLLKGSRRDFKILLYALRATGGRPKELTSLTWDQVQEDRWVLPQHKTAHKTHRPRIIYLPTPMRRLMQILRRERRMSDCHVFLNSRNKPWSRNAIRLRIGRIRKKFKLAPDVVCYLLRHAFGTAAVLNGVDIATVAQLMGHTNLEMVSKVYLHLAGQDQHLHLAAERATKSLAVSRP